MKNTADATGTDPAGHPVTATGSTVTPTAPRAALLTVDKAMAAHDDADHNGSVSVGDTLRYEITATNAGNVTQTAVTVSDPRLGAMTCTPNQPATLKPGEHLTCTGSTTVTQADVDAGEVVNTATATGTPPPGLTTPPAAAHRRHADRTGSSSPVGGQEPRLGDRPRPVVVDHPRRPPHLPDHRRELRQRRPQRRPCPRSAAPGADVRRREPADPRTGRVAHLRRAATS